MMTFALSFIALSLSVLLLFLCDARQRNAARWEKEQRLIDMCEWHARQEKEQRLIDMCEWHARQEKDNG